MTTGREGRSGARAPAVATSEPDEESAGPIQKKALLPPGYLQYYGIAPGAQSAGAPAPSVQRKEAAVARPNDTGLPDNVKSGVESLSGMSLDGVKVHYNSAQPAQMNAHAYTQGSDIHVGPGQEQHLAHEAWHVVQQSQGRVAPTVQMAGGVGINDDGGLEREADVMGAQALERGGGAAVEHTPATVAGPGAGSARAAVQRKINYGEKEFKVGFRIDDAPDAKTRLEAIVKEATGLELNRGNDEVYYFVNDLRKDETEVYDIATEEGVQKLKAKLRERFPPKNESTPVSSSAHESASSAKPESKLVAAEERRDEKEGKEVKGVESPVRNAKPRASDQPVKTEDEKAAYLQKTYAAEIMATETQGVIRNIIKHTVADDAPVEDGYQGFSSTFKFYKSDAEADYQANSVALTVPDIEAIQENSDLFYAKTTSTKEGGDDKMSPRGSNGLSIEKNSHLIAEHELIHLKILANNKSEREGTESTNPNATENQVGDDPLYEKANGILEALGSNLGDVLNNKQKNQYHAGNQSLHWLIERISYAMKTKYDQNGDWHELPTTIRELRRYFVDHQDKIPSEKFAELDGLIKELDDAFAKHEGYAAVEGPSKK